MQVTVNLFGRTAGQRKAIMKNYFGTIVSYNDDEKFSKFTCDMHQAMRLACNCPNGAASYGWERKVLDVMLHDVDLNLIIVHATGCR